MNNKKLTGSFYTPRILSDFLVQHIFTRYVKQTKISCLEPSCGDGIFLSSLSNYSNKRKINIDILDINNNELTKASQIISKNDNIQYKSYNCDYLDFFLKNDSKYSLVIGNPPYIKKNNLGDEQIKRCEEIHTRLVTRASDKKVTEKIKNIWPAFVEAAIMSLNDQGILCFVIPAEILQVIYAKNLRKLICNEFDRIEIFAFNELIFEGIQQDVVALIGVKGVNNTKEHGFSFYQVDKLIDLKEPRYVEKNNNVHRTTLDKWTNYILKDEELNFVDGLKSDLYPISNYCKKAEVGIVSAANDYFILNKQELEKNKLHRLKTIVKPILPKGYVVPKLIDFNSLDFALLGNTNKPVNFLHFPNIPKNKLGKIITDYINKGEAKREKNMGELHTRYKMKRRENWYHVPSIWSSEGLFIKRCHEYPKIIVNSANVLATDSFYRIITKPDYDIKNLVFSFYNSLTFVLAELEGRFYGGGVLELTPNEFKNLAIPYSNKITDEQFNKLDTMFRNKTDIEDILNYTDSILLPNVDVSRLRRIRTRLMNRRMKKTEE